MIPALCARGQHPVEPGRACASCAARNVAPEQWATPAPARAPGAFVVALRVPAAAPRRCAPMPPLRESYARTARVEAPCARGCGAMAIGIDPHRRGPAPTPGTEDLCQRCRKAELRDRRELAAALGDA